MKQVHVLPREMLGSSTFGIAMKLLRWLPVKLVDRFLLFVAKMILGDTEKYGLNRPKLGPLEIKDVTGKSPVLDVGAWSFIKSGNIKVCPMRRYIEAAQCQSFSGHRCPWTCVVLLYRSDEQSSLAPRLGPLITHRTMPSHGAKHTT